MEIGILSSMSTALQKGDVKKSLDIARDWLATALPGEPEELLSQCPSELRPKLALVLRDLLSRYPATILGAPVLMYCTTDDDDTESPPASQSGLSGFSLPYPEPEFMQPCSDLHFLGWLPFDAQLPVKLPFRPEQYLAQAPTNQIFAAIALFRSHPDVFELEALDLPNHWWGELFRPVAGSVRISARMLLPYPDALEATRVLHASALGEPLPARIGFLSDNGWSWSSDAGELFYETCRHQHPSRMM